MASEQILLDPTDEGTGTQLDITDATLGYFLLEHVYPEPDDDVVQAGSIDTEGANPAAGKHQPRTITAKVRVAQLADASVNLVTNPSAEVDTAGWTATGQGFLSVSATSIARVTSEHHSGVAAFRAVTPGGATEEGVAAPVAGTFRAGTQYTVSAYVRAASSTAAVQIAIGSRGALDRGQSAATALSTSWQRVTATWTPSVDRVDAALVVKTAVAAAATFEIDDVMVTEGATATAYFDGDSPGALWTGTPHASTSALSITTQVAILQRKIGKLFREGGTYRRVLPSGDTITFDVLRFGARINVPADKRWITRGTADVTITLTCQPYGLGPSTSAALTPSTATSKAPLVCTATGIKGDVSALGTLTIGNATSTKTLMLWGLRSRYYDASHGLFYEAESLTAATASLHAGPSGASGGGANKVMRQSDVGTSDAGSFSFRLATPAHIGTYRLFARVQANAGNTGTVSVQAQWYPRSAGLPVPNDWVAIEDDAGTPIEGSWVLVDLGLVTVPKARTGAQGWLADFRVKSTVSTDDLDWDWIALVPADEASGRLETPDQAVASNGAVMVTNDAVQIRSGATTSWYDGNYEGDYLLIPPAGAEGRTVEMIVILTGTSGDPLTDTLVDADSLDAITATLTYRPRYLSVPAP